MANQSKIQNPKSKIVRLLPHATVAAAAIVLAALLPAPERPASADVARETGIRVLGATRGYATTALWLRAGEAYRRGDYLETMAAYQLIAELQPRNPAVYSYISWNQGYNISAPFPEHEQRLEWVVRGLNTLYTGQDRMPLEATLRVDEWHYVLNRSIRYPIGILDAALSRYRETDPRWALLAEHALQVTASLDEAQAAALREFLEDTGFHPGVLRSMRLHEAERARILDPAFDLLPQARQGELGLEFAPFEREQARALYRLAPELRELLAALDWCRWHLLTLTLKPALILTPRPLILEMALLNTYRQAWLAAPVDVRREFAPEYRKGVAQALRAGIENAGATHGEQGESDFRSAARENLSDVPELAAGLDDVFE